MKMSQSNKTAAPSLAKLALVLAVAATASAARAESFVSSAASDSASSTSKSLSESVHSSSHSSDSDKPAPAGRYRVQDMTPVPARDGRPAEQRVRLAAVAGTGAQGEFFLTLPEQTAQVAALKTGAVVNVAHRPYGLEFSRADNQRTFFMALKDEWMGDTRTQVLSL